MNIALLLPAALAALAALLLPLLIHLARRGEQRPTDFAALRWLRQKPKPRHRVRFDEWPLLIARLLLLTLLAVWLARPALFGSASETPWVAVMPGIDLAQARAAVDDDRARLHWLAPGFPTLDRPPPASDPLPFASLLRQLDSELPAAVKLSVLVPERLQGADAQRPRLSRAVEWKVLAGAMPARKAMATDSPALAVRYSQGRQSGLRYLRAAAAAWQPTATAPAFDAAPVPETLTARTRHLVWLAPGPLPPAIGGWIRQGGTALLSADTEYEFPVESLVYWRDELGAPLVEGAPLGRGRVLRFTRAFAPAAMPQLLQPEFPRRLRELFATPAPAPARVAAQDYAPVAGGAAYPQPPRDLQSWLALLIAALLLVERWLATRRRRAVSP
ncbi:MAG: BatA domain-containing protein [Pseudoxanthomonas sp.]